MINHIGKKFFLLIDCNSFFVSCERIFRPDLKNKPVIVLSSNDGCIVARSKEAKKLGLKMGEPYFKIKNFLEKNGVYVFSSNFSLYQNISKRVMSIVASIGLPYEISSIDEAFLICDQMTREEISYKADNLFNRILKEVGIPVSVGISHTKTLAKLASEIAKQKGDPTSLLDLENFQEVMQIFSLIRLEEVWGMGRQTVAFLNSKKIETIRQFIDTPSFWVKKNLGIVGERMWLELRGYVCYGLDEVWAPNKSISSTRSFGQTTTFLAVLESAITSHILNVTEQLRAQKHEAKNFHIFISAGYGADSITGEATLNFNDPTNDPLVVNKKALIKLKEIFQPGIKYKKAGVTAHNLVPENFYPHQNLFGEQREKNTKLLKIIDRLNYVYGSGTIRIANAHPDRKEKWTPKHGMVSPRYTDNWNEILKIRV